MLVLYHSVKAGHMLKKKDYRGVSSHYEQIAQLKKNEGYGDYAEGLAYYYQKNWNQAREAFESGLERGIKYQKKSMEPLTKMALITTYMQLNKWNKAGQLLEQIENDMDQGKKIPAKLHAVFNPIKGEFLYHKQLVESALSAFRLGYARYPELMGEEAYYYAKLLAGKNQVEEAKAILDQLLNDENDWKFFRISVEDVKNLWNELSS